MPFSPRKGGLTVVQALQRARVQEKKALIGFSEEDIALVEGLVQDMFSAENIVRALTFVKTIADWTQTHVPPIHYGELDAKQPRDLLNTIAQYQIVVQTMNSTMYGEVMEMWERYQFYEKYKELKDQIAGETGEVWAWVQRQPTVQGRNHQALLIDEFTRQLTQALPDTVEWVDVRSKMSNDLTLSGNVWSLCHAFGAGILPLVPPRSRNV